MGLIIVMVTISPPSQPSLPSPSYGSGFYFDHFDHRDHCGDYRDHQACKVIIAIVMSIIMVISMVFYHSYSHNISNPLSTFFTLTLLTLFILSKGTEGGLIFLQYNVQCASTLLLSGCWDRSSLQKPKYQ